MTAGTAVGAKEMSQVLYGSIKKGKGCEQWLHREVQLFIAKKIIRVFNYEQLRVRIMSDEQLRLVYGRFIILRLDSLN